MGQIMGHSNPMIFARHFRLAMAVMVSLLISAPSRVMADDSIGDFFSTLRPPQIKLPHIDIVPFWTDDLKRARCLC